LSGLEAKLTAQNACCARSAELLICWRKPARQCRKGIATLLKNVILGLARYRVSAKILALWGCSARIRLTKIVEDYEQYFLIHGG
jgi:hypothetical protein